MKTKIKIKMRKNLKNFKNITYLLISIISLGMLVHFGLPAKDTNILETSVLTVLKAVNESIPKEFPDLSIEKVTLKQIEAPKPNFNYYKFKATLVIHNSGGSIVDRKLMISAGENQKYAFVKNTPAGFSLMKDKNYIIDNYEVLFDGKYNGGNLKFKIKLMDTDDASDNNNEYTASVFAAPPLIKDLKIEEVLPDGTIAFGFTPPSPSENFPKEDWAFFVAEFRGAEGLEENYAQVYTQERLYDYFTISNLSEALEKGVWGKTVLNESDNSLFFKMAEDPFVSEKDYYVYLRATDPLTGNFIASEVIKLPKQSNLTNSAFAKYFVDYAGIKLDDLGENPFNDVVSGEWYAPYVQTLYNDGLLGINSYNFYPEKEISRGEALKIVTEYFDGDLKISEGAPHFEDVKEEDPIYPYVEAFYAGNKSLPFGSYLNSELPATKNYVKYLIDAYKKNR
jgi:hypothetical protein